MTMGRRRMILLALFLGMASFIVNLMMLKIALAALAR